MPQTPRNEICAGCQRDIDDRQIACTNSSCKKVYDLTCANAVDVTQSEITAWICPECCANRRKTGDFLPAFRPITPASKENVTVRYKSTSKIQDPQVPISDDNNLQVLINEIRAMRQDLEDFRINVSSRLEAVSSALLESGNKIKALEKKQEDLERRNLDLEASVQTLQGQIAMQSQHALKNEIEILGVQEVKGENPTHLVMVTAQRIGVAIDINDIDYAARVGPQRKPTVEAGGDKTFTRPLVVRFTKKITRDSFLVKAKSSRTLDSKDIVDVGPGRKIYVNERLTAENRQLFRAARQRATECGYKFCWVKNGSIFVKRGEKSPAMRICLPNDVRLLVPLGSETSPAQ